MKTKGNILIITWWDWRSALIQTYTLPYVRIIRKILPPSEKIFLVTLEKDHHLMASAEWKEITSSLEKENIALIGLKYYPPGVLAVTNMIKNLIKLKDLINCGQINTIHSWCTPAGMMGYILSKLTGKKLILDSFEPHAEAMVENGAWHADGIKYKLLFYFEKKQAERAKTTISAAPGMDSYSMDKYGIELKNNYVKPACVDLTRFTANAAKNHTLLEQLGLKDATICVYAGKFGGIYLSREVFQFFMTCTGIWPNFKALILSNHDEEEIKEWCAKVGLDHNRIVQKFIDSDKMPEYLALADFAITPVKPVPTKKYCTPIKTGEYWATGLPVVITRQISNDSMLIKKHNVGAVLEELTEAEYKRAANLILNILKEPENERKQRCRSLAEENRNFSIAHEVYASIYAK